jgi:hypothetical protein
MSTKSLWLTIITITIIGCAVNKPSSEQCNSFRSGQFVSHVYNTSRYGHWTKMTFDIKQTDSLQIVTRKTPITDTTIYKITWKGPCAYNLLLLTPRNFVDSFYLKEYPKGQNYKIVSAKDQYLIVSSGRQVDTLWRVNAPK